MNYDFMEVSLACSDAEAMAAFFVQMFDGQVIFKGSMAGEPFVRMVACGITFVFREDTDWPGDPVDPRFRNHLGLKVDDLGRAIDDLEGRGARFALKPEGVAVLQQKDDEGGAGKWMQTTFVAPPLTLETLHEQGYRHDVAILEGPDRLWIELNEVHMPPGIDWF